MASNTVLSLTSSAWTLVLGRPGVAYRTRVLAVALCIPVGFGDDSDKTQSTIIGNASALVSAFFYGAYTTVLKRTLLDEERYSMGMVFGALGVFNTLLFWPGLIVLHYSGGETFEFPDPRTQLWPLALNAVVGTNLSDVMWAHSVVLTSPVTATLGLSLTIPIAMVGDWILAKTVSYGVMYVCGAATVTAGFVLCNF